MTDTTGSAASLPDIRVPALLTFAGLVAGLAAGLLARSSEILPAALSVTAPVGDLWLRALEMTILPLVAGLLFTGIIETAGAARGGVMARRTLGLFFSILVAGAILSALAMPALLQAIPVPQEAGGALGVAADPGEMPGLGDFLASFVPDNVFAAAADGAVLPVIVFVALFALASMRLDDGPRILLARIFRALAHAMMVIVGWVLALAPVGVFALAFGVAARTGSSVIGALGHYIALVSAMGVVILLAAYVLAIVGGRKSPTGFARAVLPAQAVALSTQSSLASLPAMLASCRRLQVRDESAEFVLPLAVALFRATSPAMNLAVVIYAAALTGVELTPGIILAGVVVASITTLGSVSLPGTVSFVASTGPIALAMGVPVEPLALLVAVEMLPDIVRTVANVTMDVSVTTVADRQSAGKSAATS
ncbi:glutamate:proton symporter [Novosphingobium marinum]|uniref:Na+/H+-dicarboxylate symporter n=1 Tax=Novosphingobium marinum TaxID=1514948 RepID=A0A7Z0BW66_9SPHN|nr:dicarboxylate/amino acid:cation symporter [Novosphingobium marinum]NYH95932.1 Na+/H+-dicarboxylate symporter [Novosphingobium marinum]GGC31116.1 glutamate:proton symporter [Novosphingobium marinum]